MGVDLDGIRSDWYDPGICRILRLLRYHGREWILSQETSWTEKSLGLSCSERRGGFLRSGVDLHRQEDPGVHLSHCLLCLHRYRPVGRSHHLQDQETVSIPARYEELVHELWPRLRDLPGHLPLLLPGHGQGSQDVPALLQLVVARPPLLPPHLLLRREQKVLATPQPRRLDRARDLLLSSKYVLVPPLVNNKSMKDEK